MDPDSSKNLHPARLSRMARPARPLPARVRIRHPGVPAAELFATIRVPRPPMPETLADVEVGPSPSSGFAVVIDIRELLRLRASSGQGCAGEGGADVEGPARDPSAPSSSRDLS